MSDDTCKRCGGPDHPIQLSEGWGLWYKWCRGGVVPIRDTTRAEREEALLEYEARVAKDRANFDYAI